MISIPRSMYLSVCRFECGYREIRHIGAAQVKPRLVPDLHCCKVRAIDLLSWKCGNRGAGVIGSERFYQRHDKKIFAFSAMGF
jgi:hypothetical protein